jgi:hypothetical protein
MVLVDAGDLDGRNIRLTPAAGDLPHDSTNNVLQSSHDVPLLSG